MMTQTKPARQLIPGLAEADQRITDIGTQCPSMPVGIGFSGPQYDAHMAEYRAWETRRDQAIAERDTLLAGAKGLICSKCQGTGMTQWRHRSGGTCYQCNGDGWTAKGRRLHEKGQA